MIRIFILIGAPLFALWVFLDDIADIVGPNNLIWGFA
jgi:hypothetical protein